MVLAYTVESNTLGRAKRTDHVIFSAQLSTWGNNSS